MELVEVVKSSVDIVSVVGQHVRLKRVGASARYMGLCPFHTEKTPSFSVHSGLQFYKCFGCGKGGDVINFVMELERVSFYEALKLLAEQHGIPLPKRSEYADEETKLRAALYRMHEIAADVFRDRLAGPSGKEARDYLQRRGVSASLIQEFGLGYTDPSGQDLVRRFSRDFTGEQLDASGLVTKRPDGSGYYDRFRGRLMFPIHNESGKIIAFAGRALRKEDEPKYLNSAETPIYRKSYVLYNLHRAKDAIHKRDRTVLVEGYMDVIGVYGGGVREVAATCGTALTPQQIKMLKRHSGKIVLNFDPDAAGSNAAERSIQLLLDEGMQVRILQLDGGLDPDEYVKERGAEAYEAVLERAGGYFHWLADRARAKYDFRTTEGRIAGFQFLLPAIHRISDRLERMSIANDVAGYLGVEPGLVLEEFRRAALRRSETVVKTPVFQLRAVERILLKALLSGDGGLRGAILPELKNLPAMKQLATKRIFEVLFTIAEKQGSFGYADVDSRLEEPDKALLASVAFADDLDEGVVSLEQAKACLSELENADQTARVEELRTRVRQAERAGDLVEAMKATEELDRLKKGR